MKVLAAHTGTEWRGRGWRRGTGTQGAVGGDDGGHLGLQDFGESGLGRGRGVEPGRLLECWALVGLQTVNSRAAVVDLVRRRGWPPERVGGDSAGAERCVLRMGPGRRASSQCG